MNTLVSETQELLEVARGDAPADLLLRNGRVVNVFTGEIEQLDVAVCGDRIAGLGSGYEGAETVELDGAFVCPGLIDAHVHIESAMVPPRSFGSVVLPHGVTAVVADPHEIANVSGIEGVHFMLRDADATPLSMFVAAPSCVPATRLASSGAELSIDDLAELRRNPQVVALGEMMSYQDVIAGGDTPLRKVDAFDGLPRDGHAPQLDGRDLCAYLAAGIDSDHECTTAAEARSKLSRGMTIFIREGTLARNLERLAPLIDSTTAPRICFCTDDRTLPDLLDRGSIDDLLRRAIASGIDPATAIRVATLSPADHFGLRDRGAVAPGRVADFIVFDDLQRPFVREVFVRGRRIVRDGDLLEDGSAAEAPAPRNTVDIDWSRVSFTIPAKGRRMRVIGVVPDRLSTESSIVDCDCVGGQTVADPQRDLLKMAVIERHRASGRSGLGFVRGMGLRRGAIAGTVAHDHHNLVVIGADDGSMMTAARAVAEAGGGLAVAEGRFVLSLLPLPIAGLMSPWPVRRVSRRLKEVTAAACGLGSPLADPFMTMSFLALEVMPSLKLTDHGLIDVEAQRTVPLFVD